MLAYTFIRIHRIENFQFMKLRCSWEFPNFPLKLFVVSNFPLKLFVTSMLFVTA